LLDETPFKSLQVHSKMFQLRHIGPHGKMVLR
jgi:hypothetical protein